jgi:DNA topoisomerase-1
MPKLVIVESPTKARTISRFLGKDFKIESSYGHIRDLPEREMGVDIENNFEPTYVIPPKAKKRVALLKKLATTAPEIILATDEDREGEAISWHLTQALGLGNQKLSRIVFHEITKSAIENALKNPRGIDTNLVDAQQARRILDRLVGYELSPFLWKKIKRGLSAGRVQSVALRLIVEREREIERFKPEEYWTVEAELKKQSDPETKKFIARLAEIDGKPVKKFDIKSQAEADQIVKTLQGAKYQVSAVVQKETRRFPAAPFTTSTLQQEAARKLGLSAKQTMMQAQELYETGYITYMRTDSVNLAEQALRQAREVIKEKFGPDYALATPRRYKTKSKGAQEAHEAIRPTDLSKNPETLAGTLDDLQAKLYELIWKRTLASQMPEAIFDQTSVDIKAGPNHIFRATGQVLKFDGFIKVYTEGRDEKDEEELTEGGLPKLILQEILNLLELGGKQHFTEPPPRFTDASLVKALEEYGIGRPSTYAPTISTILERGYVERKARKFYPTEIGTVVNDLLVENFPIIMDYEFTAKMENELDEIAEGKLAWQPVIKEFYDPFHKNLMEKQKTVEKQVEQTDIPCPECGKPMVKKFGRFGQFLACSDYPKCKGTKPLPEEEAVQKKLEAENSGKVCSECGQGELIVRRGKFGYFLGCNRYPKCRYIERIEKKTGVTCPECGQGELVEKRTRKGRTFWGCNRYPECKYATWENPQKP